MVGVSNQGIPEELGMCHRFSSVPFPQSNGCAELCSPDGEEILAYNTGCGRPIRDIRYMPCNSWHKDHLIVKIFLRKYCTR